MSIVLEQLSLENELLKLQHLIEDGGPEAPTALFKKVKLLLSSKRQFECIETLIHAHQRYPDDDRWPATLASIWMNLGDLVVPAKFISSQHPALI